MILDFDMVTLHNFKSFRGDHAFDLLAYGPGLHFMRGRNRKRPRLGANGTGKSTLLVDAICWCLYGQTSDGLKNNDVKPWHYKGPTSVGLAIMRGKEKHSIVRSANPNRLTIDRKDAGQADVDQLIGMGLELFKHTVVLPQGEDLFFDLQPRDRMQLFVDALTLDRWDERAKAASDRVAALERRLSEYEGEETGCIGKLKSLDALIVKAEKDGDAWAAEWKDRTKKQASELKQVEKDLDHVITQRDLADSAYDSAETELRQLARDFEAADEELGRAQRLYDVADMEDRANKSACLELKKKIESLGEGDKCDMCGQSVKGTSLARHRKELKDALRKREKRAAQGISTDICERVDDATAKLNGVRGHLLKFRKKRDDAKDTLDTYDRKMGELSGRLQVLKNAAQVEAEVENPFRKQLRQLKDEERSAERDLDDIRADQSSTRAKIERAKFWTKGFKDIRLFVLEEIMREFELNTNAMLDEAGLVGWQVAYPLERETARGAVQRGMSIYVQSPESEGMVKWESWSGGEAQRLRIVGALALSETLLNHAGVEVSMEVLDEPTQHLSPEGVSDLCEYLSDRAHRLNRQIWYVDHQSIESTRFRTVTTIRRDDRGSMIVK